MIKVTKTIRISNEELRSLIRKEYPFIPTDADIRCYWDKSGRIAEGASITWTATETP